MYADFLCSDVTLMAVDSGIPNTSTSSKVTYSLVELTNTLACCVRFSTVQYNLQQYDCVEALGILGTYTEIWTSIVAYGNQLNSNFNHECTWASLHISITIQNIIVTLGDKNRQPSVRQEYNRPCETRSCTYLPQKRRNWCTKSQNIRSTHEINPYIHAYLFFNLFTNAKHDSYWYMHAQYKI